MLEEISDTVQRFHQERAVFITTGVRDNISLPRQHSMSHYRTLIEMFGAPNGLCSSITESRHIKAVKEPWRRSNRYEALGQMLVTNQRLDKISAARLDYANRGMLEGPLLSLRAANEVAVLRLVNEPDGYDSSDENGVVAVDAMVPHESTYDVQMAHRRG